jgi:hypothetical protein
MRSAFLSSAHFPFKHWWQPEELSVSKWRALNASTISTLSRKEDFIGIDVRGMCAAVHSRKNPSQLAKTRLGFSVSAAAQSEGQFSSAIDSIALRVRWTLEIC